MKLKTKINCIRIWSPGSEKIKNRFFLKSDIIFGSDLASDICITELEGLQARLDFQEKELSHFQNDKLEYIEEGQIFQLGPYVFQWKTISPFKKSYILPLSCISISLFFILIISIWPKEAKIDCSARSLKLASGYWGSSSARPKDKKFFANLQTYKLSFLKAVKNKNWLKARSELNEIELRVRDVNAQKACGILLPLVQLERRLSENLIRGFLKDSSLLLAAEEIQSFKTKFPENNLERFEKRIMKDIRKKYFQGYRLEEKDPEKAFALMEQAEEACMALGLEGDCFRPKH
jgi:hypothetical protein